ncbi:uncharacterized protein LOC115998379 isoform X3 [Ipomoea triloba]|uniref:uncharacterized protein LOC115998379 isoform X3 n=1 Tax=Ipomoea triloba TaxID=35885 RepID=UPI00125E8993|nr:uncharacterized protein LOC115998379 isoform X3 [Ipomoea triloba]
MLHQRLRFYSSSFFFPARYSCSNVITNVVSEVMHMCVWHQARSIGVLLWSLPVMAVVVRMYLRRVVRESVIILPGFGVQLETQYRSGRITRRFVASSKILKPVLNECVTPVTCYWSLSLIIHGEEQLLVVFKELRPPVKTLVPIWKALCASIECGEHIHE